MMIPFGKMASFEEVQNRQNDGPTVSPAVNTNSQTKIRGAQVAHDGTRAKPADPNAVWPVSKSQLQTLSAIGYTGPVPADWKEANAIIKQMGKTS
jgi:hypothetical protein